MANGLETSDLSAYTSLPTCESWRLIDFTDARVVPGIVNGTWILIVSGEKPYQNMDVVLSPRIYIQQPDYWGIEVTGHLPAGIGIPATAPYTVSLPLHGTVGKAGIEVIGANQTQQIDVQVG